MIKHLVIHISIPFHFALASFVFRGDLLSFFGCPFFIQMIYLPFSADVERANEAKAAKEADESSHLSE